jgi:hypothetical protein
MDVFYYWKDVKEDLDANRIGCFRSSREKLAEFQDGAPDYLWVFKTPKGLKGQVQLLARLKWTDVPVVPVLRKANENYVFYDPNHAKSVRFTDSSDVAKVDAVSAWVKRHFPATVRSNFQGENGQQALRGEMLRELNGLIKAWPNEPFLATAE